MKKIFIIILSFVLLLIFCIPMFAVSTTNDYLVIPPDDLGNLLPSGYRIYPGYNKYYLKIDTNIFTTSSIKFVTYYNDQANTTSHGYITISISDNKLKIIQYDSTWLSYGDYFFIVTPLLEIPIDNRYYYIPIYGYNATPDNRDFVEGLELYYSSTTSPSIIAQEAYNTGYANGYNTGYTQGLLDYPDSIDNLNLVQHIELLIGNFTGNEFAHYITPIALVIVILFVYFLFIRLILSLLKAKNATKICDIVVLIGCVILLLILYAPMLDLTIKNESVVETTTLEETVRVIREPITVITDETGEIMYGPVGTVKILYESISTENIEDLTESALSIVETTGG